ncbi:MAG: RNA polymerase Rpb4 family protein [Candidatus Micrarchaeia archaeon]
MEIKSSKAVTVSEAREIMAKRKEDGELGYEQQQALDNSEKFAKLDSEKAGKMVEALVKSGKLNHETAIKVADICPDNPATLRAILVKDRIELSEDEINGILKIVA